MDYLPCEWQAERFAGGPVGLGVEGVALGHRDGEALGVDRRLGVAGLALQYGVGEPPESELKQNQIIT